MLNHRIFKGQGTLAQWARQSFRKLLVPEIFAVCCDSMPCSCQKFGHRRQFCVLHAFSVRKVQRCSVLVFHPKTVVVPELVWSAAHEYALYVPHTLQVPVRMSAKNAEHKGHLRFAKVPLTSM